MISSIMALIQKQGHTYGLNSILSRIVQWKQAMIPKLDCLRNRCALKQHSAHQACVSTTLSVPNTSISTQNNGNYPAGNRQYEWNVCGLSLGDHLKLNYFKRPVEVAHLIMDHLELMDLCHLSSVNVLSFQCVSQYYHHNFSIRRILLPFFMREEDLTLFRDLQRTHDVLVSGSQALSLFNRMVYQNSDLDLYVQHWQRCDLISVLEHAGYTRYGSLRPPSVRASITRWQQARDADTMTFFDNKMHVLACSEYSDKSIADVEEFRNGLGAVVQIISCHSPLLDIVLGFHSS